MVAGLRDAEVGGEGEESRWVTTQQGHQIKGPFCSAQV